MACYDTEENGRSEYTKETMMCLRDTVDTKKHRIIISDNGSCTETQVLLKKFAPLLHANVIHNGNNLGTARAINKGMIHRRPEEYCVKIDNDVIIHSNRWVDEMEAALDRQPSIGILGLKRKDIEFDANHQNAGYRSELVQLPHVSGQTWISVEKGPFIMGTCTIFNWRLMDKIGGMKQTSSPYGLDDTLYSLRSVQAGFWNAYLPHIEIDHIDRGDKPYQKEKEAQAMEAWPEYQKLYREYLNGERELWEEFE